MTALAALNPSCHEEKHRSNPPNLQQTEERDYLCPKIPVTDPITDQEMAFAHLIMSGTMNDRRAAEAVGLNPETAAYTKSKPRVRAYMMSTAPPSGKSWWTRKPTGCAS